MRLLDVAGAADSPRVVRPETEKDFIQYRIDMH